MMAQSREVILQKMRDRSRRLREADLDAYRARQRQRYVWNRETIRAQQADRYTRRRDEMLEREKAWREANPESYHLQVAKRILSRKIGVRIRDIPVDLAHAKALELELKRLVATPPPTQENDHGKG